MEVCRFALISIILVAVESSAVEQTVPLHLSWGHRSPAKTPFYVVVRGQNVSLENLKVFGCEAKEIAVGNSLRSISGGGDVDGLRLQLRFQAEVVTPITNLHSIWRYLVDHADDQSAARLLADPGNRPDNRLVTIQLNEDGTRGFSFTIDQLLTQHSFWVPHLDLFVTIDKLTLENYLRQIARFNGMRVRDVVAKAPEPTYADFTHFWEDMGNPAYKNPHSVPPGHIVGLAWDSSVFKFGVDRGASVYSDYGSPDPFRFRFDFGDISQMTTQQWNQSLSGGLPVIQTTFVRDQVKYHLEQFAYPFDGPPSSRVAEMPMLLFQRLRLENLNAEPNVATVTIYHERKQTKGPVVLECKEDATSAFDVDSGCILFSVQGSGVASATCRNRGVGEETFSATVRLPGLGAQELLIKLPSPPLEGAQQEKLLQMDYEASKRATLDYWSLWLAKGALFQVPDQAVNELFRANFWHALRLPRRHTAGDGKLQLDLPYSNFAYDQKGIPWPINQAVYVDNMLYDLRGYHALSAEELEQMFLQNQEPNGHIKGFANWGVYTPGMVYAVARHLLLSDDPASLERLLAPTLRSFDWCLNQINTASAMNGPGHGLVLCPLNDLSHENSAWAFNQAYLYAGSEMLGRVLEKVGHPRATEVRQTALRMRDAVQDQFARASVASPLVQLRDHTWTPYVPSDALSPRRSMQVWYPTEVDTGALHLPRLGALDPRGELTAFLLDDHEDNLFFRGLGMANEPVYNQSATAWLLRDEIPMVVRAFYSMMACAFSQSTFEPVEHRWGWGQYFGPPSTDGAWFELYRNMLIREADDDTLFLMQAMPRKWLEDGREVRVERAPTHYGPVSFSVHSSIKAKKVRAEIELSGRAHPRELRVRFRHPTQKPIQRVRVNGRVSRDFDVRKEWVRILDVTSRRYAIEVFY